ncbi:MAG TPA: hypothetical protein VMV43_02495 [Candidatus Nanopelagicaceae bacterium]|jgi:hypothetical protein|nr:hypothetical protein [Candidatus Nanopelagicaceae bacterium]
MIDSNTILMILNSLESPKTSFKSTIDKFVKIAIKIATDSEDFKDELKLYDDIIYHIYIYDIDYNIWIKKKGTSLSFNNSFYEENSENVEILHCILTKNITRKILIRKVQLSDAFMRGLIKINGNLSDAIHARNLWKLFLACMDYLAEKNE